MAHPMGRFETEFLATDENLAALAGHFGHWIDRVHDRRPPKVEAAAKKDGKLVSCGKWVVLRSGIQPLTLSLK